MKVGDWELALMSAIECISGEAYGMSIVRYMQKQKGHEETRKTDVYVALRRIVEKGLAATRIAPPLPVQGGRRRRVYTLTEMGAAILKGMTPERKEA